jgi:hypothetical protein
MAKKAKKAKKTTAKKAKKKKKYVFRSSSLIPAKALVNRGVKLA